MSQTSVWVVGAGRARLRGIAGVGIVAGDGLARILLLAILVLLKVALLRRVAGAVLLLGGLHAARLALKDGLGKG